MSENFKYTAFISYSHADKKAVRWLHRALEGYRIPKNLAGRETPYGKVPAKFKPFFRDRDDLSAAASLTASIKKALRQSKFLVVVCSPDAAKSKWVNREIAEFEKTRGREYILCLIVGDKAEAASGVKASDCFPENLLKLKAKGNFEPIAADCRPEGDGKRLAKLKLVSGLLGVELDQLVQRENRRRQIQTGIVTSLTAVAAIVLSVLLYIATEARKEADANRLKAEERQVQAENLVGFMLGDLKTKLEPIGSLQVMDDIAMQALGYYSAMDVNELDVESLSRRSEVLLMMGEIEQKRGNLPLAQAIYQQAFLTTEELLLQSPNNPDRIFDHSQSVFWVANIYLIEGNLKKAEEGLRSYANYSARLAEIDPANLDYQIEVGYAHSNIGTLLYRQGNYSGAEKEFQGQLEIFQALANQNPDSQYLQYELGQSLAWLSDSKMGLGQLQVAKEQKIEEMFIYQNLLETTPQNIQFKSSLLVTLNKLSVLYNLLGEPETGSLYFGQGLELGQEVIAFDKENTVPVANLSWLILDYIETGNSRTSLKKIQPWIEQAKTLTNFLIERENFNRVWLTLHYRALLAEARALYGAGKVSEGLDLARTANSALTEIWMEKKDNPQILGPLGLAALVLAEGLRLDNQPKKSEQVLQIFVESTEEFEKNMTLRAKDFLSRAWLLLGFGDKAQQKRDFLSEMGYNPPDFKHFWETWGS